MIGNIIWFVFAGLWLAIRYAIAAFFCFILIITIPFGVASLRIAMFTLWPFGRVAVPKANKGAGSAIGNVIWFVIAGWWVDVSSHPQRHPALPYDHRDPPWSCELQAHHCGPAPIRSRDRVG